MLENLVVGYDGSGPSKRAFQHALELARRFGAHLWIVAVVQVPEPAITTEVEGIIDLENERLKPVFQELAVEARAAGVEIETESVVGHPAEQLIHYAEGHNADLLVVGSRGRSRLKRWMLGSVSERVLRYASCSVLVIR